MIKITKALYQKDFKIWIEFNDGTQGIADLNNDSWGKIFEPLKDINLFKKFRISEIMNTIVWENGADLSPKFLCEKIKEKTVLS